MNKQNVTFFLVFLSLAFISCHKDVFGCTDPTSDNYNSEATRDDGSCSYHGNLTCWYDTITRDSMVANNIASVVVYVDNEVVQNVNPNIVVWSSEPPCPTTSIGNWITMNGTTSRTFSVTAKAFNGSNIEVRSWSETETINAGECKLFQIIW